jgi:hypothetical protein
MASQPSITDGVHTAAGTTFESRPDPLGSLDIRASSGMRLFPKPFRSGILGIWDRVRAQVSGEISVARTYPALFGGTYNIIGPFVAYNIDTSRVNYRLCRELYYNTNDKYKLGAGFARPAINITAGFMGPPHFVAPDQQNVVVQKFLDDFNLRYRAVMARIVRNCFRDGDVFTRFRVVPDKFTTGARTIQCDLIPPEWMVPIIDPDTGEWEKVTIVKPMQVVDPSQLNNPFVTTTTINFSVVEEITPLSINSYIWGAAPEIYAQRYTYTRENPFGFIPIVHFKNEMEEAALFGASDLEPIEPFLKTYHDVALFTIQGSKLFTRPKVKFKLANVEKFLQDNFSQEEIDARRLMFADKEIFLVQTDDDVQFITADNGARSTEALLQLLFYCIISVSETPEFAFGPAVKSSRASVQEQMLPLERKISRKREGMSDPFVNFAGMYLQVKSMLENVSLTTYDTQIGWDQMTSKDDKATADTVKTMADAMTEMVTVGMVSVESASEFMRQYITTVLPWNDPSADMDEIRRVQDGLEILARAKLATGFGGGDVQAANQPGQGGTQPSQRGQPTGQANTTGAGGDVASRRALAGRSGSTGTTPATPPANGTAH